MKLNLDAFRILEKALADVPVKRLDGARIIDLGVKARLSEAISWEIASSVAEACLGGLGEVNVGSETVTVKIPTKPALACLGSQMSGWAVNLGGETALGSGPARILAVKPRDVYERLGYSEKSDKTVLCLESKFLPDEEACNAIISKTGVKAAFIVVYPPDSVVGLVQVLARVVEMGVYRLDFLGYDTRKIVSAKGSAPLPKLNSDVMYAANDAIIYGGFVELVVDGWDASLTEKCVSSSSPAYGKPFKEIFTEAGGDFYKIDPAIFAPAQVRITDKKSGKTITAGERKWPR
ncbi:MAG: methenyltetrahydromethanopterin cyclohydrolase [Candidatus Altiarchaeota archaeon]